MGPNGEPRVGAFNNQIYNNTIYIKQGIRSNIVFENLTKNNSIYNNILYVDGILIYSNSAGSNSENNFDGNLWFGNYSSSIPFGTKDIQNQNPLFVNKGGVEPDDYKTTSGSPAINAGLLLANNGGKDYFGNKLSTIPDIGFFETKEITDLSEFYKYKAVSIYPNPVSNNLNIRVRADLIGKNYSLFNQMGQKVLTRKIYAESSGIEISTLSKGIYFFCINDDLQNKLKLIVQ